MGRESTAGNEIRCHSFRVLYPDELWSEVQMFLEEKI